LTARLKVGAKQATTRESDDTQQAEQQQSPRKFTAPDGAASNGRRCRRGITNKLEQHGANKVRRAAAKLAAPSNGSTIDMQMRYANRAAADMPGVSFAGAASPTHRQAV